MKLTDTQRIRHALTSLHITLDTIRSITNRSRKELEANKEEMAKLSTDDFNTYLMAGMNIELEYLVDTLEMLEDCILTTSDRLTEEEE